MTAEEKLNDLIRRGCEFDGPKYHSQSHGWYAVVPVPNDLRLIVGKTSEEVVDGLYEFYKK